MALCYRIGPPQAVRSWESVSMCQSLSPGSVTGHTESKTAEPDKRIRKHNLKMCLTTEHQTTLLF